MKYLSKQVFLLGGIAFILLAAFPVFAQNGAAVHKKPLTDFTDLVIDRLQKNRLVLSDNFLIELDGELTKEGKFDRRKTRYIRAEGTEQIVDVAKSAVEAINEDGILAYLTQLGANRLNIIFAQNDEQIYAVLKTEYAAQNTAQTTKTTFDMLVKTALMQSNDEDEKTLLNATTVSLSEKTVTIKTALEKPVGQEMIQRRLTVEINKRIEQNKAK